MYDHSSATRTKRMEVLKTIKTGPSCLTGWATDVAGQVDAEIPLRAKLSHAHRVYRANTSYFCTDKIKQPSLCGDCYNRAIKLNRIIWILEGVDAPPVLCYSLQAMVTMDSMGCEHDF